MPPRTYFTTPSQRRRQQELRLRSTMTVHNSWSGTVTQSITVKKAPVKKAPVERFNGQGYRSGGRKIGAGNRRIATETLRMAEVPAVVVPEVPAAAVVPAARRWGAEPATIFTPVRQTRGTAPVRQIKGPVTIFTPSSPPEEPEPVTPSSPGSFQVLQVEVPDAAYTLGDLVGDAVDGNKQHTLADLDNLSRYWDSIRDYNREHNIAFAEEVYVAHPWLVDQTAV